MARYRGTVRGGRGEASRLGHKTTGLTTVAKSWHGIIETRLYYHPRLKIDWARVVLANNIANYVLYDGPVSQYRDPRGKQLLIEE